jgi:hypothetical protein
LCIQQFHKKWALGFYKYYPLEVNYGHGKKKSRIKTVACHFSHTYDGKHDWFIFDSNFWWQCYCQRTKGGDGIGTGYDGVPFYPSKRDP